MSKKPLKQVQFTPGYRQRFLKREADLAKTGSMAYLNDSSYSIDLTDLY